MVVIHTLPTIGNRTEPASLSRAIAAAGSRKCSWLLMSSFTIIPSCASQPRTVRAHLHSVGRQLKIVPQIPPDEEVSHAGNAHHLEHLSAEPDPEGRPRGKGGGEFLRRFLFACDEGPQALLIAGEGLAVIGGSGEFSGEHIGFCERQA